MFALTVTRGRNARQIVGHSEDQIPIQTGFARFPRDGNTRRPALFLPAQLHVGVQDHVARADPPQRLTGGVEEWRSDDEILPYSPRTF